MRRILSGALASLCLLAVASSALAQTSASSATAEETAQSDCARARALGKTCVLTIGAEEVEGGVIKPEGDVLSPRLFIKAGSLIHLRSHFIPEILKSAQDLM